MERLLWAEASGRRLVEVARHFSSATLPAEYAYHGSAARALTLRSLKIDTGYLPRDTDLVRIFGEPFPGADESFCRKFMPDDFSLGFRIELIDRLEDFFESRDLSIVQFMLIVSQADNATRRVLDALLGRED